MRCISPLTFRKGSVIQTVPCGKCNFCLQNRRNDWTFRIEQEHREASSAWFITLTYDEKHQPTLDNRYGTLKKKDFQDFMKRLRKFDQQQYGTQQSTRSPIKYYAVGEYGENTFRPHYHAIVFNAHARTIEHLDKLWGLGHSSLGTCETASIHYVTKYVIQPTSKSLWAPLLPPFSLISKGMGKTYLHTNGHHHKKALETSVIGNLGKQRLPRYYADKIFSIRERELIQELAQEQDYLLYWEVVNALQERNPNGAIARENIIRELHDNIKKKIKANQLTNTTI